MRGEDEPAWQTGATMMRMQRWLVVIVLAIAGGPSLAAAEWHGCARPGETLRRWWTWLPCWPLPEHSARRAGYDGSISPLAMPTDAPGYVGYYVGGGAACGGEPRYAQEGIWGWDYQGILLPRRVSLSWWHGRKYQGGTGQYQTDGLISPFAHPPRSD